MSKRKHFSKALTILLAVMMIFTMMPTMAWADVENSGEGEAIILPDASITVPSDAKLFVGSKTAHYVAFTEIEAMHKVENENSTTTYYFDLSNNSTYNYRVSGEGYVTYAGTFKKTANYSLNVTKEQLKPEGVTTKTVDRDVKSNNGYNVADIYLNINPQGYLKLDSIGSTYQIVNLRNWEAVDTIMNNYFIEPDYHYTVINESGTTDSSVVTANESGLITAVGNGTAIVLVTYDAININGAAGGPFFGAIWPENTGVFVVSVGAGESGIETSMTLNEGKNTTDSKLSGDAIDSEHDVIYFIGEEGEYTFTPKTEGLTVSVANPTVDTEMSFNGFTQVNENENENGSFTVPLKEGRNIVKLEKDGKAEYQVITAKKASYTVNDGKPVVAGDEISVKFDTLYNPVGKLAGVYNPTTVIMYDTVTGYEDALLGGTGSQYNFASNIAAQTVANVITKTINAQWNTVSIQKGDTIKIPAEYEGESFTLSGGTFFAYYYGDPAGNHRGISYESGKAPNLNALQRQAYLGKLPDIEIPITSLSKIEVTKLPTKLNYNLGDQFNPAGMEVTATFNNGQTDVVTDYTVNSKPFSETGKQIVKISYTAAGKTATATVEINVSNTTLEALSIEKAPDKVEYLTHQSFDPTGMTLEAIYSDGTTEIITDFKVPTTNLNTVGEEIPVVIKYGDKSVVQKVKVEANTLSKITINKAPNKLKYIVGEYFDPTGAQITATYKDGSTEVIDSGFVFRKTLAITSTEFTKDTQWASGMLPGKSTYIHYSENGVNKYASFTTLTVKDLKSLTITTSPAKTDYTVGGVFNPTGIKVTATYSDNTTEDVTGLVKYTNTKFTEVSNTHAVTVEYAFGADPEKQTKKTATVNCKVTEAITNPDAPSNDITVYFTLLGDAEHGDSDEKHTYKAGNLTTWLAKKSYAIPADSTVLALIERALGEAGIPFENATGNYISSVKGLAEFDNGNLSGWMYTLNGVHPNLGVAEQTVKNGDVVVFHYTDDYTVEQGSEKWNIPTENQSSVTTTGTSGSAITTTPTEVTVSGDTAKVTVKTENMTEAIKQAKENKSAEIVLQVSASDTKGAENVKLQLDTSFVKDIAKNTGAKLTIQTEHGNLTLDHDTLTKAAADAKGSTIIFNITKGEDGKVQATVTSDDAILYSCELGETTEEMTAAQVKELTAKLTPVARSVKTAKKNVKVTLNLDKQDKEIISQLEEAGYTVKYKFYRSTRKASKYASKLTSKKTSYTNTAGKKGTKYYYKARVQVYDKDGKLVAQTELKQCKYASRTWSK